MRLYELESMCERTSLTINVLKSSNGDNSTGTEMTMTTERTVSSSEAQSSHCSTITRINSKRKKDRFARIRLQTDIFYIPLWSMNQITYVSVLCDHGGDALTHTAQLTLLNRSEACCCLTAAIFDKIQWHRTLPKMMDLILYCRISHSSRNGSRQIPLKC